MAAVVAGIADLERRDELHSLHPLHGRHGLLIRILTGGLLCRSKSGSSLYPATDGRCKYAKAVWERPFELSKL